MALRGSSSREMGRKPTGLSRWTWRETPSLGSMIAEERWTSRESQYASWTWEGKRRMKRFFQPDIPGQLLRLRVAMSFRS